MGKRITYCECCGNSKIKRVKSIRHIETDRVLMCDKCRDGKTKVIVSGKKGRYKKA